MAQKLVIVDDRTEEEGAETVCVKVWLPASRKAVEFEIDLAPRGQADLAEALRDFIAHGRPHKVRGATPPDAFTEAVPCAPPRVISSQSHTSEDVAGCKRFLLEQGITPPTGKIRNVFWDAYHNDDPSMIPAEYRPVRAATG